MSYALFKSNMPMFLSYTLLPCFYPCDFLFACHLRWDEWYAW